MKGGATLFDLTRKSQGKPGKTGKKAYFNQPKSCQHSCASQNIQHSDTKESSLVDHRFLLWTLAEQRHQSNDIND